MPAASTAFFTVARFAQVDDGLDPEFGKLGESLRRRLRAAIDVVVDLMEVGHSPRIRKADRGKK
jgi:hypothetical protein